MEERLQKYMARCGVDSRRKCEDLIAKGMVEINGAVVREPGVKIDPMRDKVYVNGKRLRLEQPAYYIHYKTRGVTTTVSDDLGRRTVMDCLPDIPERVYPVGRLDKDSEGLLLLTNDGALANFLTHPAHGVEKTYRVVAEGRIEQEVLEELAAKGMRLGPVLVKPSRVELVRYDNDNTVVLISVSEGINREVRRIFAALGHEVKRLLRTRVGPLELAGMKRGATRPLTKRELAQLTRGMEGMEPETEAEMFPAGSAAGRKPRGPRGRPGKPRAERRGKPDPAAHAPRSPKAPRPKRGNVVQDDWEKKTGGKRRDKPAADAPKPSIKSKMKLKAAAAKPRAKPKSGPNAKPAVPLRKSSQAAKPKARPVTHPLNRPAPARPAAAGPRKNRKNG